MMDFDRQFKKAMKEIEDKSENIIKGAITDLFSEIVYRTPVGNPSLWKSKPPAGYTGGTLRGNWQLNIGTPNRNIKTIKDRNGDRTVSQAVTEISKFHLDDDTIWFTNNLPYAERVEYGWSTQRPEGMVRSSVKSWSRLINDNARKNRR